MKEKYCYVKEELKKLLPVNEYGVSIKLRSDSGETKWLLLDNEARVELINYLSSAGKKKFICTGVEKVRDVIEADDPDQALMLFKAKYPAAGRFKDAPEIHIENLND